jgi:hypothetical protein
VPADLPALTRLTEDVVAAMHVAEEAQLARRRRRAPWRRVFPIGAILLALLVAGALALHASPAQGGSGTPDGGTVAKACVTGAGAIVVTGLAARRPGAGRGVLHVSGGALCR